jgi:hypothetical protein
VPEVLAAKDLEDLLNDEGFKVIGHKVLRIMSL